MPTANEVASVIIMRSGSWLDAMTLQKLLYYVQAWHLAITDEPLFGDRFEAYRDGPVVPEVWRARKDQATRRAKNQAVGRIEINVEALDLIDLVLSTYGSMSGEELSALTHVEAPWLEARGDLPSDAHGSDSISTETMARFYRAHRRLGGRTAADLAAAGIYPASQAFAGPVNVDEILDALGDALTDSSEDAWGGANLEPAPGYSSDGIRKERRRAHAGA